MPDYCVFVPTVMWDKVYVTAKSKKEAIREVLTGIALGEFDIVDTVDGSYGDITLEGKKLEAYVSE